MKPCETTLKVLRAIEVLGAASRYQIGKHLGMAYGSSNSWVPRVQSVLEAAHKLGMIYCCAWKPAPPGRARKEWGWIEIWARQPTAFALPDAVRPEEPPRRSVALAPMLKEKAPRHSGLGSAPSPRHPWRLHGRAEPNDQPPKRPQDRPKKPGQRAALLLSDQDPRGTTDNEPDQ